LRLIAQTNIEILKILETKLWSNINIPEKN
jgi:hypothetical protein